MESTLGALKKLAESYKLEDVEKTKWIYKG